MAIDVDNLGDLELAALDYIWERGPSDVESVHGSIREERDITYNTVQSAMKRLWEKGLLSREKEGYAYVYSARVDRSDLAERRVSAIVDELAGDDLSPALEAFVDFADRAGDETLDELERLIEERRNDGAT